MQPLQSGALKKLGKTAYAQLLRPIFGPKAFLFEYHPEHGFAGGGTLMLRYNFLHFQRVVPFVELGGGIVGTDLDLKGQSDGFSFSVQGCVGADYFVLPQVAATAEWRLHHISNAGLRQPNSGINDSLFLLGASFFVR